MKKILIGTCLLAMMFFVATPMAFAAGGSNTPSNVTVTIPCTALIPAAVNTSWTFDSSPNVLISVATTGSAYTIVTINDKVTPSTGWEYGATNFSTGYAQQRLGTIPTTTAPSAGTAGQLAGANWKWMGGSGGSGS